jgi:signal transduction histidine kinase
MTTHAELRSDLRRTPVVVLSSPLARYVVGVLALATAYYAAAKLGQTLRYTASVAAVWPPAGLGIAALYLWGLRWWPGIFLAELLVNGELLLDENALPLGSLIGQQAGNMAEIVVGAALLRRLIGRGATLDRVEQVARMLVALGLATAISATVGTVSMLAGDVIDESEVLRFWRTWWFADTTGALVVLPFVLVWAARPLASWRRIRTLEGGFLILTIAVVGMLALSIDEPVTYLVFPSLIWAALRFGTAGATLAIAIAAGIAIGFTANDVGPFSTQPIDHKTLSTQLYILVAALTTLFLGAGVSERERSAARLVEANRRAGELAMEERHRIARDLHDSVAQALFSVILHLRTAQKALSRPGPGVPASVDETLDTIGALTAGAQGDLRALTLELAYARDEKGLASALANHASRLAKPNGLVIDVGGADGLELSGAAESQLFGIGREALTNIVKHSGASSATVRVDGRPDSVTLEIRDNGCGFDPAGEYPGHLGLESMRSRADELGAIFTISSTPGEGTIVRVEMPSETARPAHGA